MTELALTLVLISAFFHATWNLLAKRSSGGVAFTWLFSVFMSLFYAPFAIALIIITKPSFSFAEIVFIMGTATLHIVYFLILGRGYQKGDLSLVYPLARGTGPMLATIGAVVLLGERPSVLGIVGILCIGLGVFIFAGGGRNLRNKEARVGIIYALLIGTSIATYTIWDKYAMSVLLISPLLYEWFADSLRAIFLTGFVRNHWDDVRTEWQTHRYEAMGIAILSPLAYILVLTALKVGPVSYIAALREISILIGAIMGTVLLSEKGASRNWPGAIMMVIGVITLGLGG
jgi:drug/metabolite transporter (DMT)-like permease